jgi:hypothetical protein
VTEKVIDDVLDETSGAIGKARPKTTTNAGSKKRGNLY